MPEVDPTMLTAAQVLERAESLEQEGRTNVSRGEHQLTMARGLRAYASAIEPSRSRATRPGAVTRPHLREDIVNLLRDQPGMGVAEIARQLNHSRNSVGMTVQRLMQAGRVKRVAVGQYQVVAPSVEESNA